MAPTTSSRVGFPCPTPLSYAHAYVSGPCCRPHQRQRNEVSSFTTPPSLCTDVSVHGAVGVLQRIPAHRIQDQGQLVVAKHSLQETYQHYHISILSVLPQSTILPPPHRCVASRAGHTNYTKAVIKAVHGPNAAGMDPYDQAIGFVRLDGSSGSAERRGQLLDAFRDDPQTTVCLMTKQAAGVGINLTNANVAIMYVSVCARACAHPYICACAPDL